MLWSIDAQPEYATTGHKVTDKVSKVALMIN